MTKLLAVINQQAEAIAFARDFIIGLHRGDSAFASFASREFVRGFIKLGLATTIGRQHMVDLALAGEEDVAAILRETIIEMNPAELPVEFQDYTKRVLTAGNVLPSRITGPKHKEYILRDIATCLTVAALTDKFGLTPTGRSPRKWSACAIVAKALDAIGLARDYEAVAKLWKIYGKHLHLPPKWVARMGPLP